jgi:hypothetical protein
MDDDLIEATPTDNESRIHSKPRAIRGILRFQRSDAWFEDLNRTTVKLFTAPKIKDVLLCKGIKAATEITDNTITGRRLPNDFLTITATAEIIGAILYLMFFRLRNAQVTAFPPYDSVPFKTAKYPLTAHPMAVDAQHHDVDQYLRNEHPSIVGWKRAQKGRDFTKHVKVYLNR